MAIIKGILRTRNVEYCTCILFSQSFRSISEKLAKASEQYEMAASERQSLTRKFASQLALSRSELDEVIGSLWRNHPNRSSLMSKKNLLADLRHKYQSAKSGFQEMNGNSQCQDCVEDDLSDVTGHEPELVQALNPCNNANSPRLSKSPEKNNRNSPSRESGVLSDLQKNRDSNHEVYLMSIFVGINSVGTLSKF